jgi:hypothetical protein
MDDVEVSGQNSQAQGKSFWQEHYKLMSSTIPEVVDTDKFDQPHQRRPQSVHMSYSDIARSSGSQLTQSQNNSQDCASVDTTIVSNVSRQETNDSSMNMIMGLSIVKKRMEEIDNQREGFTTKQQIMDESISTVTSSVSKFSADILAVRIDMNIMSDKLEKKCNNIIALLATTQTYAMPSSPTRKVARGANTSPVKDAASNKGPVEAFGGVVTQRKTQSPPVSPSKKVNAETWANMCDEEAQEEYMHSSVNILMEVDSADADGSQLDCQAAWVWKLRPSPILPRHRTVQELSTTAAVAINNLTRRETLDKYKHTRYRRRPSQYFWVSQRPCQTIKKNIRCKRKRIR